MPPPAPEALAARVIGSPALSASRSVAADYLELTKPRITLMVVLTTTVGFALASQGRVDLGRLAATIVGTALIAGGASALNMVFERRIDGRMLRTRARPLPALVALVTWASYLFLYTPLKPRTSLCTVVGAFPGALPPVIGWAAARGALDPGAFVLFAILFLWQIPHFLAIAWIYREDYARGGLPMLPVLDPEGRVTGRQAVANSAALLVVSLVPTAAGLAGRAYLAGAVCLGVALTAVAARAAIVRTRGAARLLFLGSLLYLPALCALLLVDRL